MSSPEQSKSTRLPRFLALLALVFVIDLWSSHHLGYGLQNRGALAPLLATLGAAATLVSKLDKERLPKLAQSVTAWLEPKLLAPSFLVGVVLVFALIAATRSSVVVVGASAAESGRITLAPLEQPSSTRASRHGPQLRPAHFRGVLTSPLGRTYRVDAPGYLPTTIEVFPLRGQRLTLGRDVPVAPAVLFRPTAGALGSLDNSGRFRVSRRYGDSLEVLVDTTGVAAFLVGTDQPVPREVQADWALELDGDPNAGGVLLRWKKPIVVDPGVSIDPGSVLEAEVLSRAGRRVASAEVRVRNERLIDVPMQGVVP